MKNAFLNSISVLLLSLALLTNCTKPEPVKSFHATKTIEHPVFKTIDDTDIIFKVFKNSKVYQNARTNVSNFQLTDLQAASFEGGAIKGFVGKLPSINGFKRDLMVVVALDSLQGNHKIVALVRENNISQRITNNQTIYDGEIKWSTVLGEKLNNMTISNNKVLNFKKYELIKRSSGGRQAAGCCWACTGEQFNATYQAAKNACENDWACDFACSFNPCSLAYLADAISKCIDCSQQ